jgi:hypothetical protein
LARIFHELRHGGHAARIGQRTQRRAFHQAIAQLQALGMRHHRASEFILDAVVHQEAGRRNAHLAGIAELGRASGFHRQFTSASSATITGAWPPSSMVTRFMCAPASAPAACRPGSSR